MITLSKKLKIFTAEYIKTQNFAQLSSSLNNIVKLNSRNGFVVNVVMMDIEFEEIANKIGNIEVNTTAVREHVGEIERRIRVVTEISRCMVSTLPFE